MNNSGNNNDTVPITNISNCPTPISFNVRPKVLTIFIININQANDSLKIKFSSIYYLFETNLRIIGIYINYV